MTTTIELNCLTDAQVRRVLVECFVSQGTAGEVGERIRQFTIQQYRVLGFPEGLRKRDMSTEQRATLRQHEINTIRLLMSMQMPA